MGKTRDLFKKIRDTNGTFHAKMVCIKDRNGMDLTEAEDIKKRWQEYTENGGGNGNPLQNSCLGNPRDRGAWGSRADYSPRGRTESDTTESLTLLLPVVKARVPTWAPRQH